jgi:cytochrome oxidase Cu insertion factor (SCO1/SenC/PrrC family)
MKASIIAAAIVIASLSCSTAQRSATSAAQTAVATPVQVGEKAPDFTLEDQDGRKVTLSPQFGKTKTVLVFYRGSW